MRSDTVARPRSAVVVTDSGDSLRLEVDDNGRGLPPEAQAGPGVRGMRERSLLVGGRLSVAMAPRGGVRVSLEVPLADRGR